MTKISLREKIRCRLEKMTLRERRTASARIAAKLMRTPQFKKADRILAYAALPDEVQTRPFIEKALRKGKRIYLPRIDRAKRRIAFFEIADWEKDLKPGPYGILEPVRTVSAGGPDGPAMDLAIVPGRAFDRAGRRLGRGGGFYDRYLSRKHGLKKIGLAFKEQIVARVPAGRRDVRVDSVITD